MTATTTPLAVCRHTARTAGLAPALTVLCEEVLPGLLPCGPAGHAVAPAGLAAAADRIWLAGAVSDRADGTETTLSTVALPGGAVTLLCHQPLAPTEPVDDDTAWALGLVWVRLGLSEGLLDACVRHLGGRTTGDSTVLHQQLVKGAIADVLIEHLEVRAVLTGTDLTATALAHLQAQLTLADRALLRLLGASGFLAGGPGEVAHVSELLAEAHHRREEPS
jgi:hypothetical protein